MPDPKTGKLVPLEFSVGDTVKYRIVIQNSGATPVTGLTLSDVPHGTPGCMLKLPTTASTSGSSRTRISAARRRDC